MRRRKIEKVFYSSRIEQEKQPVKLLNIDFPKKKKENPILRPEEANPDHT
jgi:hypothetical protein